jgi:hypothetical protein
MLKSTVLASTAIAALLLVACDQSGPTARDQAQQDQTTTTSEPTPTATERAAAETANEIDQASTATAEITPAELAAGISGEDVADPQATLATAAVKTSSGESLGEVRSVVVGNDGKADAVIVEVGGFLNVGERAVSIDASKFTYLKDRNILVAAVAKSDVEALPAVPSQE